MNGSEILRTLLGGVALLLWGVRMVRTGLTRAFGGPLRAAMNWASRNRLAAFGAGVGVAGLLQSATATALLLASFARRGLLSLPVALAVMLGADIGTTLVAQVFAFDIKWVWAGAMVGGVVIFSAAKSDRGKNAGRIAIGFALMLLALSVLGNVSSGLRESPTVQMVLVALGSEPTIAVIVAAGLTWLAHSSLAVVLFFMSLAAGGVVGGTSVLALVLGANVGGAAAPFTALARSPVVARRVPLGNLVARVVLAIIALPFLSNIEHLLGLLSTDAGRLALNFHTAFNIALAALFLPLLTPLAGLAARILPAPAQPTEPGVPQHLDPSALDTPSEALACAMRETLQVGDIVLDMLRRSLSAIEGNDMQLVKEVEKADNTVD